MMLSIIDLTLIAFRCALVALLRYTTNLKSPFGTGAWEWNIWGYYEPENDEIMGAKVAELFSDASCDNRGGRSVQ